MSERCARVFWEIKPERSADARLGKALSKRTESAPHLAGNGSTTEGNKHVK